MAHQHCSRTNHTNASPSPPAPQPPPHTHTLLRSCASKASNRSLSGAFFLPLASMRMNCLMLSYTLRSTSTVFSYRMESLPRKSNLMLLGGISSTFSTCSGGEAEEVRRGCLQQHMQAAGPQLACVSTVVPAAHNLPAI